LVRELEPKNKARAFLGSSRWSLARALGTALLVAALAYFWLMFTVIG